MKNRIGIVGGGQLGKMLTIEAKKLGFYVVVIDETPESPAGQVADKQIIASVKDENAIKQLAKEVDFITFEVELANAETLNFLKSRGIAINPSPETLAVIKDKYSQKTFLQKLKIPVAPFMFADKIDEIKRAADEYGYPFLLKARTDSYDGRGNFVVKSAADIKRAKQKLEGRSLYAEKFVPFVKELAVIIARDIHGNIAIYPTVETIHQRNICQIVIAPARVSSSVQKNAQKLALQVAKHLKGAGVFAIEMFYDRKGKILVNEIAPRVHNSGHFTIEACLTNQFEQQIRAVTGMPLGSTQMKVPAVVMVNILGEREDEAEVEGLEKAIAIEGVSVHIYGKKEVRVDRKMGHITAVGISVDAALKRAQRARKYISI